MGGLRKCAVALAVLMCLGLLGCKEDKPVDTTPIRNDKPLLVTTQPTEAAPKYSAVYATAFGDTIFLATMPVSQWQGEEPDCPVKEVSLGGSVCCHGEHEQETPITRVVISEELRPYATTGWFQGMSSLVSIEGLEKVNMEYAVAMDHMFAGCGKLSALAVEDWDVSRVTDMTGAFDGCDSLAQMPSWYVLSEETE